MRAIALSILLMFLLPLATAQNPEDWEDYGNYDNPYSTCGGMGVSFDDGGSDRELSYTACLAQGSESGGRFEMMQMFVTLQGSARLTMTGMQAQGNQDGGSFTTYGYQLDLLQVVEFVDSNGDSKYVPGEDELVDSHSLSNGWGKIRKSEPAEGGIHFEADHPIGSGTFTLAGTAAGSTFSAGGISVKPLDTKIDFIFNGYDYAVPDSRLALVLHTAAESSAAKGTSFSNGGATVQGKESGIVHSSGGTSTYFTWAKTADVDGTPMKVDSYVDIISSESQSSGGNGGSFSQDAAEAGITLAYARGDEIVHDPRLGVQFNVKRESPGLPVVGIGLVLLAIAARRRN